MTVRLVVVISNGGSPPAAAPGRVRPHLVTADAADDGLRVLDLGSVSLTMDASMRVAAFCIASQEETAAEGAPPELRVVPSPAVSPPSRRVGRRLRAHQSW